MMIQDQQFFERLMRDSTPEQVPRDISTYQLSEFADHFLRREHLQDIVNFVAKNLSTVSLYNLCIIDKPVDSTRCASMSHDDAQFRAFMVKRMPLHRMIFLINQRISDGDPKRAQLEALLDEARKQTWKKVQEYVRNPNYVNFPRDVNMELQKAVIAYRCRAQSAMFQAFPKQSLMKLVQNYNLFEGKEVKNDQYLNFNKQQLCDVIGSLDILMRQKTENAIQKCESMIELHKPETSMAKPEEIRKLEQELRRYHAYVRSWKQDSAQFMLCSADQKCSYTKQLIMQAKNVRDAADKCEKTIQKAIDAKNKEILREKVKNGEQLTTTEKFKSVFI